MSTSKVILYFCIMIILVLVGLVQNVPRLLRLTFVLSAFIAFMSVMMAIISANFLQTYCLYCAATYLLCGKRAGDSVEVIIKGEAREWTILEVS